MSPAVSWLVIGLMWIGALVLVIGGPAYLDLRRRVQWERHTAEALAAAKDAERVVWCGNCAAWIYDAQTHHSLAHTRRAVGPEDMW